MTDVAMKPSTSKTAKESPSKRQSVQEFLASVQGTRARALAAALEAQFLAHKARGPALHLSQLRSTDQVFMKSAREMLEEMRGRLATLRPDDPQRDIVATCVEQMELLVSWRPLLMEALTDAVVEHEGAAPSGQIFAPAAKAIAETLSGDVMSARTGITDVAVDGAALSLEVRAEAGIGQSFRKESPIDAGDQARKLIKVFNRPDYRAHLEAQGMMVEAFLVPLQQGLRDLEAAMKSSLDDNRSKTRELRDAAQLRVELLSLRMVALVHAVLGIAARDELRDKLPRSPSAYGQRQSDRTKPQSNAANGTPAPVPDNAPAAADGSSQPK